MSETRDETTGQFAPSNDALFGRDLKLAEAGLRSMPERLTAEPEEAANDARATSPGRKPASPPCRWVR